MLNDELQLRDGEIILETFRPRNFWVRVFTYTSSNAAFIITNERLIYKDPTRVNRELNISDIYYVNILGRTLNILKRGDSLDYNYDANFETPEMSKPYISVRWLTNPKLAKSIIDGLIKNRRRK